MNLATEVRDMSAAFVLPTSPAAELPDFVLRDLAPRWVNRFWAEAARLVPVDNFTGRELLNARGSGDYSGIKIPYFWPGSTDETAYRIRRSNPEIDARTGKPKRKYLSPPNDRNHVYLPPLVDTDLLSDVSKTLIITEGEFKTIALRRLASEGVSSPRFLPAGLAGVHNWVGTVGATTNANGVRVPVKGVIPDMERLTVLGRKVIIAFDMDNPVKREVRIARYQLSTYFRERGANVGFLEWDPELGKGVDDWLAKAGPEAVLAAIARVDFNSTTGWKAKLLCSDTGKPKALLSNAMLALRQDPQFEGVLRFNEFSLRTEIGNEPPWERQARDRKIWADDDDRRACAWLQGHHIEVGVSVAAEAVQSVAMENAFHPVRDFLDGLVWDGEGRVDTWLTRYLGARPGHYPSAVGRRWLISAIARILQPGCKADCALILEGDQGLKKSSAAAVLGGEWFTDEIDELGTKDASLQTCGVWIIELSELDSMSKSEASRIKAFMSRSTDRFRPPYAHLIESPRQCVFIGTVNHSSYLRDETGARRFWPVECHSIDLKALEEDRDQLWAEAVTLYREGCPWWLNTDHLIQAAGIEQQSRYERDPWDEPIRDYLSAPGRSETSVADLLTACLHKDRALWSQSDFNRVARCLKSQGWERYRANVDEQRSWRYRRA